MPTIAQLRNIALSFPESLEAPHFDNTSFRVKKKIFATYNANTGQACIKLSEQDQDLFCIAAPGVIFPVENKWGKQGWTLIILKKVKSDLLKQALKTAYCNVAPAKLAALVSK